MPSNTTPPVSRRAPDLGVPDALVQLSFLVQQALAESAQAHDVPVQQARLLGVLRDREPGMAGLAALLELDKSSATGLVNRATRQGLVKRLIRPEDRRAVRVVLTDKGRRLAAEIGTEVERRLHALLDGLSETNRKRLSQLATQVVFAEAERRGLDLTPDAAG
jgi:MarR family transcriptional regulator, lower aerobic nicotinate degradation pathway regulator